MFSKVISFIEKNILLTYIVISIIFGFLTFFVNYNIPNRSIWDETYHISSAEKYIQKVHFMEAHPPLAKLLIASGELLINPNTNYENLNFAGRFCLYNTPESYKFKENGIEKNQSDFDLGEGKTRKMNLLDIREKTKDSIDKTSFTEKDTVGEFPDYFSFCGFRFVPVLMASFLPMLFFILIYQLTNNSNLSLFSSAFIAFDNALLVHFRSAMLDGIQMFFILLALIFTVKAINNILTRGKLSLMGYILIGLFVSLTIATKHNGLIFLILPVIVGGFEYLKICKYDEISLISRGNLSSKITRILEIAKNNFKSFLNILAKLGISGSIIFLIYGIVFFGHIWLGQNILSTNNNNNGNYKASVEYIEAIKQNNRSNIDLYLTGFEDNINYMEQYHKGVPKLNLKSETENGSYPTNWPVMNRTISFRWDTSNAKDYRYLYLIGNPFIWFIAISSLLISIVVILGKYIYQVEIKRKKTFGLLILFTALYLLYMSAMLYSISVRVMYLYHYLIPLVLSIITLPLLIDMFFGEILDSNYLEISPRNKLFYIYLSMLIVICLIMFGFIFFSPFTYHLPLNKEQFEMRNWFDFWQMRIAGS